MIQMDIAPVAETVKRFMNFKLEWIYSINIIS